MKRSKPSAGHKLKEVFLSTLVLAIFIVPTVATGWWFVAAAFPYDPRTVVPLEIFHARSVDQTGASIQPFIEPAVSITFDDGWESAYTNGLPLLQWYGFHSTQYIATNATANPDYMSVAQLHDVETSGSEIASHGVTHANLTTLSAAELTAELKNSQRTLQDELGGVPITDFASPYGAYNGYTLQMIPRYYHSNKISEDDDPTTSLAQYINTPGSFTSRGIASYTVRNTTTLETLRQLIDLTEASHGWLVLSYHKIDNSAEEYSITPQVFAAQLELLNQSSLRGVTVAQFMTALDKEGR